MELIIQRNELLAGLYLVQGIVERRTTIPVLAHVLMQSVGDGVVIAATNQEVGIRRRCIAAVKRKGMLTVSGRTLYEMVREFGDGDVRIRSLDNNWIEVAGGRSRFRLVGMDPREFPAMPEFPGGAGAPAMRVASDTLTQMIERTVFAVSADETRMNLNGIFLERTEPDRLRMVATDGHRLSMVTRVAEGGGLNKGVIVPRKAVMEIRKVLESGEGPVEISIQGGVAYVQRGPVQMSMRLVEGEFPDYRQVVPARSERVVVLEASTLLAALRRVSIVSSERTHGVKLQLEPQKLEISSINPDVGEGVEEIEVEYDATPMGIGFNARYLVEALATLPSEARIEIGLNDEVSPAALRHVDDPDYCYIVMPMRL